MAVRRDIEADRLEAAEERLTEWGFACRRNSERLGLPTMSNVAQLVAHVQAQERLQKGVRKKKLRKKHREQNKKQEPIDAIEKAEVLGYKDPEPTAKGKQDRVFKTPSLQLDSEVAQVDLIVAQLSNWQKKVIHRTFLYGQCDEIAAEQMRMRQGEYARRRRAAVEKVADKLEQRYNSHNSPHIRRSSREA